MFPDYKNYITVTIVNRESMNNLKWLIIFLLFIPRQVFTQDSNIEMITVYLFPGQGSDYRIFNKLLLDSSYSRVHIQYHIPEKKISLREYALELAQQIDTKSEYILIGVSLGGMVCTELADTLNPEKIIIISSAKMRSELPGRYTFQKYVPINKATPKRLIRAGSFVAQPLVEPDRKREKETFKAMLKAKDPDFLKRTIDMIINWDRQVYNENIIHIHGDKDHTIPIRNIHCDYKIDKGSHMMALSRGEEINDLILKILKGD